MAEKTKTNKTKPSTAKSKRKTKRPAAKAASAQAAQSVRSEEPAGAAAAAAASAEFVKENVVPLTLVATGVGLLAAKTVNGGDNAVMHAAGRGRDGVTSAAAQVTKHGRVIGGKARDGVQRVGNGARRSVASTQRIVATHPVASGLAAAALGAGLAFALPKLLSRDSADKT